MGTLYVVATPLGNLEDVSLRARRILGEVDMVFAEDTRVTKKLLSHLNIHKKVVRYDETMREDTIRTIITPLSEGKNIALVTDAGTPNISDPGWRLINTVLLDSRGKISVVPIPGPSALTALLSLVHFPITSFVFEGFPPSKKGRQTFFKQLFEEERAVVLYEAPHRIVKTLEDITVLMPDRQMVVGKELTKVHERVWRGSARDIMQEFAMLSDKERKGEFVIALAPQKHEKK